LKKGEDGLRRGWESAEDNGMIVKIFIKIKIRFFH
jgi:hypothetical protein